MAHKVNLINNKNRLLGEIEAARKAGEDMTAIARNVEDVDTALGQLREVSETVGTESGRSLEFRKMMINEDFSVAALEDGLIAANKGDPLSAEQKAVVESVAKEVAEVQGKQAVIEEAHETRLGEQLVFDFMKEAKAGSKKSASGYERALNYLDKRADAAAKRIRQKMGRLAANPVDLTADLAEWIAAKIARGGLTLAKATAEAIGEFGEKVRPFMAGAYKKAEAISKKGVKKFVKTQKSLEEAKAKKAESAKKADADVETILEKIDSKARNGQGDKITPQVQNLARQLIREGVKEHGPLIRRLRKMLDPFFPGITERETNRVLLGYGKYKPVTKDQVELTLIDLKGQGRQIEHLKRIREGKSPARTGSQRPKPTAMERRLQKRVNQELKSSGISTTDPKAQLRTSQQAAEARLRNNLEDIWQEMLSGAKRVKNGMPSNPRIEALRGVYSEAKAIYDEVFPKDPAKRAPLTDQQRVQMTLRALEMTTKAKRERIQKFMEGGAENAEALAAKRPSASKTPATPEVRAARAENDALNSTIKLLRLINRKEKDPDDVSNAIYQQRVLTRIAEMTRRMANGDFAAKPKKEFPKNPESLALEFRAQKAKEKYEHAKFEAKLKQRELPKKIWDFGAETMHTFRALMTSFDLSAVGRQGIVLALGHPVKATVAIGKMLKALVSKKKQFEI